MIASACSSSSSNSTTTAPTTSSAATSATSATTGSSASSTGVAKANDVGITATTIRIGVIADVDTAVNPGLFQKNVNMVKAWATQVNAQGGLAGRQVVVDFCDSKLDPNASTNCVIQACQNDFALVGTAALGLASPAVIDTCKNSAGQPIGIPNLNGITQNSLIQCDKDSFSLGGADPTLCATEKDNPQTYTVPVGDDKWLASQYPGLHGVFVYNTDSPVARLNQIPVYTADSNNDGIKLDGLGFYGSSCTAPQSALLPTVLVMKQHGSTFAQDGSCPANFEQLQNEAKLQGVSSIKVWMCAGGCYTPYYISLNPSVTEGTYQNLTSIAFYTEYAQNPTLAAEVKQLGGVQNMDSNALASYVEALLFQDAVNKAVANGGTLTRQSLFNVLNTQETAFNADGIIGTTNVSTHSLSPCFAVARVINGKWQRVYPAKPLSFDCTPSNLVQVKINMNS
jgi:ABC-type branched-subunit amino acid transport system substrate-binding protein